MIPTPEEYIKQKGFGQPVGYIPTPDEYLSFKQHQKEWQARVPEAPEREGIVKGFIAPTAKQIGREGLAETGKLAKDVATGAYLPETISQAGVGLTKGVVGFGDMAITQAIDAAKQLAGKGEIDWEAVKIAGEERLKLYEQAITDPGAQALLGSISSVPAGARQFFVNIADRYKDRPNIYAGLMTIGDMVELAAFGKVFKTMKGLKRPGVKIPQGMIAPELDTTAAADMAGGKFAGDIKRSAAKLTEAKALPAGQGFVLKPGRVPTTKALPPGKAPKLLPAGQGFELIKKVKEAKVEPKKKVPQPLKEAMEKFRKAKEAAKGKPKEVVSTLEKPAEIPPEATEKALDIYLETKKKGEAKPKLILPKKVKKVKELTIKGAIIKAGYMNLEAYKGEKLSIPAKLRSAITRTKTGIPVDEMLTQLQKDGYIDPRMTPEQFLEKMRTNPEFFEGKKKLGQVDITDRKKSDLTKQERKVKDQIEHELEGPPKGDYEQINAQDLPVGKNVIVIENKSKVGWDEYKVIKKDPFEITLEDGETIKLGPLDKVEVLKKDVPKGKAKLVKPKAKEPLGISDVDVRNLTEENIAAAIKQTPKDLMIHPASVDELVFYKDIKNKYRGMAVKWNDGKVGFAKKRSFEESARERYEDYKSNKYFKNVKKTISTIKSKPTPKQAELLKVKPKLFGEPEALKQPKRGPKEKLAALEKVERQATSKFVQKKIGEPTQDSLFGAKKILKSEKGQVEIDLSIVKDAGKGARDAYRDIKKMGDEFIGVVSTRLGNIDPKIKYTLRKYEFKKRRRTIRYTKRVLPMLKKVKSMTAADKNAFDLARKNANEKALQGLIVKYKMGPEYAETRKVLNEMYDEAKAAGFDVGYRKHFHPRVIKDSEGFLNYLMDKSDWPLFDEAIKAKEVKLNRYLEADEKAQVINSMLRGYQQAGIKLSVPGQLKARKIEKIWPELNKFYHNSDAALIQYINKVTQAVEGRKIFGKGENINDSIGAYVLDLVAKGKITPKNEIILRDILNARFNEKGTRGVVGMYKNLSYIDTMGSPISALTQIGDLTWALYRNGIPRTTSAVITAIKGKSIIKPKDLGIERIAQEFMEPSRLSNAVNLVFKAVGLEKIDFIGKEALITSAIKKAQAMAKNPKRVGKLRAELKPIFGEETGALIADLKEGYNSENVKLYAFNVLSDFQPITLAEMPQKYLTGGNGRIFYMLKTFTIKQFDVYRREVFQQIKKPGTRIKGIKNLTRLTAYFVAANATADTIKSLVLGRPIIWEDTLVDNILRLFGISKFVTWKAREEGVGSALLRQVLFPVKAIDAATKDVLKNIPKGKKLETPASIPLVGKLYYWWFGKGAEKSRRREKAKQRKKRSKHRISGILRKVKGLKTIKGY